LSILKILSLFNIKNNNKDVFRNTLKTNPLHQTYFQSVSIKNDTLKTGLNFAFSALFLLEIVFSSKSFHLNKLALLGFLAKVMMVKFPS